jgi:hypothetical protein
MELLTVEAGGSLLRVCPVWKTHAWNASSGKVEIREPQQVTGEKKGKLLENQSSSHWRKNSQKLRDRAGRRPATFASEIRSKPV